jgi:hypothetical protein
MRQSRIACGAERPHATYGQVHKYLQKISGPLLDRIDIHIEVPRLKHDELTAPPAGENSESIRERAVRAFQSRCPVLVATWKISASSTPGLRAISRCRATSPGVSDSLPAFV